MITQTAAQLTAMIHLTIARGEIRNVMGPGINEVTAAVAAQGIAPAGPWFTHHLRMDPATFDFEICVPVTAPVAAVGRVQPGQLPATTVARTVYHGHYEGLGAAWGEFDAWIKAQGHTPAPDLWECYAVGPEANADPASWRTELNRPLRDFAMPLRVPRPQAGDYVAEDYEDYIRLVPTDRDLLAVYSEQEADVDAFYHDLTEGQAAHRYAAGKWSLKEMLGHVIDNERIMSYRLLCIARGETAPLPGYHDTAYVSAALFEARTAPDLLSEFHAVRPGTMRWSTSLSATPCIT